MGEIRVERIIVGPLHANCFIIKAGDEAIVIDPGGETEKILENLGSLKLKSIILTHHHFDHVQSAEELKNISGAPIYFNGLDSKFYSFAADRLLSENDSIKIGNLDLKVLHTPGHTMGSICLLGKDFILTGDTFFENGIGRKDLLAGSCDDMQASMIKLREVLREGTTVYPGHGKEFKI